MKFKVWLITELDLGGATNEDDAFSLAQEYINDLTYPVSLEVINIEKVEDTSLQKEDE